MTVTTGGRHRLPTNEEVQSALSAAGGQRTPRRSWQKMPERHLPPDCMLLPSRGPNCISCPRASDITKLIVNMFMQLSIEPIAQAGPAERRPAGISTSRREGVLRSKPCTGGCLAHMCSKSDLKLADNSSDRCPTYMSPEITAFNHLRHTSYSIIENSFNTDCHTVPGCFKSHKPSGQIHIIFARCSLATSLVLLLSSAQMPSPSSRSKSARRLPTRMRLLDAQEEPTGTLLALREAAVAKAKARPAADRATGSGSGGVSAQARTGQGADWTRSTDWARNTDANGWRHWQWSSWASDSHDWQWERVTQPHMSQAASSTGAHSSNMRPENNQSISQLHHIEVAKRQLATLPLPMYC